MLRDSARAPSRDQVRSVTALRTPVRRTRTKNIPIYREGALLRSFLYRICWVAEARTWYFGTHLVFGIGPVRALCCGTSLPGAAAVPGALYRIRKEQGIVDVAISTQWIPSLSTGRWICHSLSASGIQVQGAPHPTTKTDRTSECGGRKDCQTLSRVARYRSTRSRNTALLRRIPKRLCTSLKKESWIQFVLLNRASIQYDTICKSYITGLYFFIIQLFDYACVTDSTAK